MSQPVINTSPYFDDFDADKDYYKVLFKPGFPVQARELTTLQSILQNQIGSFAQNIFKEGSVVVPGSITYNSNYNSVVLNTTQSGVEISLYLEQLVGTILTGEVSGVTAKVINYILPPNDGVTNPTIFVQYTNSGTDDSTQIFTEDEALIINTQITYGNTTISAGSIVATTVPINATFIGSAANIGEGIYFIRGTFVRVANSTTILDPYLNLPSFRVGLQINEVIVTANQDSSLFDNAKGFNNFSAPGADRLKIETSLIKKLINDTDDTNFVELLRIENGDVKILEEKTNYNVIRDYLAERTFDESGDYVVNGLDITIDESLNNNLGNGGIYQEGQSTSQGGTPSKELSIVKVNNGKAYVRGFDIENPGTQNLDSPKPRTTEFIENTSVPFQMGTQFIVNNVNGTPSITLDTNNPANDIVLSLYEGRLDNGSNPTLEQIGFARPYSFNLEDAPYSSDSTRFELYTYDTQFFTKLELTRNASSLVEGTYIQGVNSGATGYLQRVSTSTIFITDVSGQFLGGEPLLLNDLDENFQVTSTGVRTYSAKDVKSISQDSSSIIAGLPNFSADTILYPIVASGFTPADSFRITSGGVITCPGKSFTTVNVNDIVIYQSPLLNTLVYNRVTSNNGTSLLVAAITSVTNVANGSLPASDINNVNLRLSEARIFNTERSSLYTALGNRNVSSVSLENSNLIYSKQVTNLTITGNELVIPVTSLNIDNSNFVAFDQERYQLFTSAGVPLTLSSSQVRVTPTEITFSGLSNQTGVSANLTASKNETKSKTKILLRSQQLLIDKSRDNTDNVNRSLTFNEFYGLRIEDKDISLNVPDVEKVIAIYESLDDATPILDILTFAGGLSLDTNTTVGENVIGSVSGAIAQLISVKSPTELEIVYLSQSKFIVGESISFSESNLVTNLQKITAGVYKDITSDYTLDKGQREQFYDYSRIIRTNNESPKKKVLVIFNRFDVPDNDKGDFYTVNSYDPSIFRTGVPLLSNGTIRASDTLDFRPRVAEFLVTNSSPFYYLSRDFAATGSTVSLVATPNEDFSLGYNYYLGRIDRILLNTEGQFKVIFGAPSANPELPATAEPAIELARIEYPPYLYEVTDANIINVDNRRYTMRDIGDLEDRIESLEEITTLSLLERETESLQILDADGNSRFKTGFFVDDFNTSEFIDYDNPETNVDADVTRSQIVPRNEFATLALRPQLSAGIDANSIDLSQDLPLSDPNTVKTGDLITLKYDEVQWITQPFASRTENVNPFNVILYDGSCTLNPSFDDFVETRNLGNRRIDVFGPSQDTFDRQFVENIEIAQFMRERNVGFDCNSLRPLTLFFPFFEGSSGIDFIPKLIEISMVSGAFEIGETVQGFNGTSLVFSGRVAQPNHKRGPFNAPRTTYSGSPYDPTEIIPDNYSPSSTILNIDTSSLDDISDERFFGLIGSNVRLVGRSSGSIANITSIRLVTDSFGDVIGSLFFRDPYSDPAPRFTLRTGARTFRLSSSSTDETPSLVNGSSVSFAEAIYTSSGAVQNIRTESVGIRDLPPPPPPVIIDQTVTNNFTRVIDRTVTVNNVTRQFIDRTVTINRRVVVNRGDPLAQTFTVDETGAFLTSINLFFATKSETDNLRVQIRTTELGTPTLSIVQNFADIVLSPDQINISNDASVATEVILPSPLFLETGVTYAIVLLAPTTDDYTAWIAQMGENNIGGQVDNTTGETIISQQYLNGSLFKSQNGQIWTPSQFEDLKFTLFKALFVDTPGTVFLENSPILTDTRLVNNPITTLSRQLRVPITPDTLGFTFTPGQKLGSAIGNPLEAAVYGDLISVGGEADTLSADIQGGSSYVDGSYTNVSTFNISSLGGEGLTVDVTVSGGEVTVITINDPGNGYVVGDTVGITTSEVDNAGEGAVATIETTSGFDTLYLDNVNGESITVPEAIFLVNPTTLAVTDTNYNCSVNSTLITPLNTGNVFVLDLPVHGLTQNNQFIDIEGILPNTPGIELIENLGITSGEVVVTDSSSFETFEGRIGGSGFLYIGGEIIEYEYVNGTINIENRGVNNTAIQVHEQGELVYKFEFSGVSLTRINTRHETPSGVIGNSKGINSLPIEFDRTSRPSGDNQLNFNITQQVGGSSGRASQNFQFDRILPSVALLTPGTTTQIESTLRTVTGTSSGGTEVSYQVQGFEDINLNDFNRLNSPRIAASRINEQEFIPDIPQNRSLTVGLRFSSTDGNLSPVIDATQINAIIARFSLNNPVSNYATDSRVTAVTGDPHASIYISNRVDLENPSTSLEVLLTAYRDATADFRVLYRLFGASEQGSTDPSWRLFPGYTNLENGNVVNLSNNNGLPDRFVRASNFEEFLEYEYNADNLPEFSGYQIKIDFAGTNEARPPFFRDIRTIALG